MYQSNRGFNIPEPPPLPRAYPEHLTPFPAQEGGHLITIHRGWVIRSLALILCYKSEMAETNFNEFKGKDCVFMADWLKTKGQHKQCSVFEGV